MLGKFLGNPKVAQHAVRTFVNRMNLNVKFDLGEGQPPHTDGKTIHVQQPVIGWSQDDYSLWWAILWHETRHNTPRGLKCFDLLQELRLKSGGIYANLLNCFEDVAVDTIGVGEHRGIDQTVAQGQEVVYEKYMVPRDWKVEDAGKEQVAQLTSTILAIYVRQAFNKGYSGMWEKLLKNKDLNPWIKHKFGECLSKRYDEKLLDAIAENDPHAIWEFVKDIAKNVFELEDNAEEEKKDVNPEEKSSDEEEDSESEEESEGKAPEGSEAESVKPTSVSTKESKEVLKELAEKLDGEGFEKPDGELKSDPEYTVIFNERPWHSHSSGTGEETYEHGTYGKAVTVYDVSALSRRYEEVRDTRFYIVDYAQRREYSLAEPGNYRALRETTGYYSERSRESVEKTIAKCSSLSHEVKKYLQAEARIKTQLNLKKGKLDKKKLHKIANTGATDDYRSRIFYNKTTKLDTKTVALSIGGDYSGSMCGEKLENQAAALYLLWEVCEAIGINTEVWGFTTRSDDIEHLLFKPFNTTVPGAVIKEGLVSGMELISNNNDGENILYAYNRLLTLPVNANRKIMLILSDGQPDGPGGDIYTYTKEVIIKIEAARLIELHAIGILTDCVSRFYKSFTVLKNVEDLEQTLLDLLTNKLLT